MKTKSPDTNTLASDADLTNPSRRQFIKKAAIASAVAAAGPAVLTKTVRAAAEPINIGSVVSLTGYNSDAAQNVVEGLTVATDMINSKGGLLGRPIKLLVRDDEMKAPVGSRRFEDLVKIDGIVMHSGVVFAPISNAIQQANKQLGDKGVILWQAATNILETTPEKMQSKLFFAGSSLEAYGLVGAEHAANNLGKKTFILYADYAGWGWVIRDAFLRNAKKYGIEVLGTLGVPPGAEDYQPFLNQISVLKLDFVAVILQGTMMISCMKQAYAMGLKDKTKFISFHDNIEEENGCGPEVFKDVVMVTEYFWNLQDDKNKIFLDAYFQKYGTNKRPSFRQFVHYASVLMWADAVRKVGSVDPDKVARALPGLKGDYGKGMVEIRKTPDHITVQPIIVARAKGPKEMKDKFDTQEIVKVYTGEQYFYSPKERGWA